MLLKDQDRGLIVLQINVCKEIPTQKTLQISVERPLEWFISL